MYTVTCYPQYDLTQYNLTQYDLSTKLATFNILVLVLIMRVIIL